MVLITDLHIDKERMTLKELLRYLKEKGLLRAEEGFWMDWDSIDQQAPKNISSFENLDEIFAQKTKLDEFVGIVQKDYSDEYVEHLNHKYS